MPAIFAEIRPVRASESIVTAVTTHAWVPVGATKTEIIGSAAPVRKDSAEKNAAASEDLARLVEEEGLADYYAQAYRIVALSYARIEKWEAATRWAHKSYELNLAADEDAPNTLEMRALTEHFIQNWNTDLYNKSKQHG